MPDVSLGQHFESFVQDQVARGHFKDADDVIRAGLRLVESRDADVARHRDALKRQIDSAFYDPAPSIPAADVFDRLERRHDAALRPLFAQADCVYDRADYIQPAQFRDSTQ